MSAWLVSKAHLDYMVEAAIEYGVIQPSEARATGEMWLRENHKSLAARYGDEDDGKPYKVGKSVTPQTPEQIISAVRCYEYQACEHDEWMASKARATSQALLNAVIAKLPDDLCKKVPGRYGGEEIALYQTAAYDACSWGINA